jgi:hypothetical protein
MGWMLERIGRVIASYLDRPEHGFEPFVPPDPVALRQTIRPGDVLLVEGNSRISGAIKYLTQSTWSHAALYVGSIEINGGGSDPHNLVEALLGNGVVSSPLAAYTKYHTRICLSSEDCRRVCEFAISRIGVQYDLKNIIDLGRYLVPLPVPQRWRRRMIALGSGDPTRLICSGIVAQAFQSIRYPILPNIARVGSQSAQQEILRIRHSSLFVPRDFDISPYFAVVKPTIEQGFDYRAVKWADDLAPQLADDLAVEAG